MFIHPRLPDCVDRDADGNPVFSEEKHEAEDAWLRGLLRPDIGIPPVGRAVVIVEKGVVRRVVVDRSGIHVAVIEGQEEEEREPGAPELGATISVSARDDLVQSDPSFVEKAFSQMHESPVHIRLACPGLPQADPYEWMQYLSVVGASYIGMVDRRRLYDPEACVQLARWLNEDSSLSYFYALHFRGGDFIGCTAEQAQLWRSSLLLPRNLYRATLMMGGDAVMAVYLPSLAGRLEVSLSLIELMREIDRIGLGLGITLRDLLIDAGPGEPRKDFISVLHPGESWSTPYD